MRKLIASLAIVFITLFSGCSDDGGGDSTPDDTIVGDGTTGATEMVLSSAYTMAVGGVVERTTTGTEVSIVTNLIDNTTTVTLLSGSATCTECTR